MTVNRRHALASVSVGTAILAATIVSAQSAERHPHIRTALRELEQAREELRRADHDFGGHRVDAVAACDRAIEQLRVALQFDRK